MPRKRITFNLGEDTPAEETPVSSQPVSLVIGSSESQSTTIEVDLLLSEQGDTPQEQQNGVVPTGEEQTDYHNSPGNGILPSGLGSSDDLVSVADEQQGPAIAFSVPKKRHDRSKFSGRYCCKKVLKLSFSHIGLSGMVIAYTIFGGFIFKHLEQPNELAECKRDRDDYYPLLNLTSHILLEISMQFRTVNDPGYVLDEFEQQLTKFGKEILTLGYNGTNCTEMEEKNKYQWSFPGALLFSVTVITTIGKSALH